MSRSGTDARAEISWAVSGAARNASAMRSRIVLELSTFAGAGAFELRWDIAPG